jgi:hypothetical protein
MVSNTLVLGKMKTSTRPRDWTAEEIKRYGGPPPAYKDPNAHPTVGVDVPLLPAPTSVDADTGAVQVGGVGIQQFRYVDPDGRLLGLDYDATQPPPKFPPTRSAFWRRSTVPNSRPSTSGRSRETATPSPAPT